MAIVARPASGITFTTVDNPLAAHGTQLTGISGNNLVGSYFDSIDGYSGFLYDGSTFTSINHPLAYNDHDSGTYVTGISGNTILGTYHNLTGGYGDYGFTYDGSTFSPIGNPAPEILTYGIDGNRIVGYYAGGPGFLFDGSTFTQIIDPFAQDGTFPRGVSGNIVVGFYETVSTSHGFLYNGSTFTNLDDPLAAPLFGGTKATGISGNNVVGYYFDNTRTAHGFFYNGSTFTTIDDPLAATGQSKGTFAQGISGNKIVGYYVGSDGYDHGFVATIPEPCTLVLAALGGMMLLANRRRPTKT